MTPVITSERTGDTIATYTNFLTKEKDSHVPAFYTLKNNLQFFYPLYFSLSQNSIVGSLWVHASSQNLDIIFPHRILISLTHSREHTHTHTHRDTQRQTFRWQVEMERLGEWVEIEGRMQRERREEGNFVRDSREAERKKNMRRERRNDKHLTPHRWW